MATEEEVGDFLQHYGVRGMHWGKRKQARVTEREGRGDIRIARSGGSTAKASWKVVGRQVLTDALLNVGVNVVGKLSGSPSTVQGAAAVAGLVSLGTSIKSINDLVDINAAKRKDQ